MYLEGNAESWKRTAAICFISATLMREGGRGPCLGAFGVCGLGMNTAFPSFLLQWEFKQHQQKWNRISMLRPKKKRSWRKKKRERNTKTFGYPPNKRPVFSRSWGHCSQHLLPRAIWCCVIKMELPRKQNLHRSNRFTYIQFNQRSRASTCNCQKYTAHSHTQELRNLLLF